MVSDAQEDREKPVALLHDDYEIICVTTDLAMEGVGGLLYPARRVGSAETNLIAIVGDRSSCFHLDFADAVEHLKLKSLLMLHRWGIVNWPGGGQRVVLIYDRPTVPTLAQAVANGKLFSDNEIKTGILPSVVDVLRAFSARRLTHGSIRANNIFLNHNNTVVLGDCLSSAPSQFQPAAYLTIERGMTAAAGRGIGTIADDIYALGVTLLTLLIGETPMAHFSDQDIVSRKMEHGTFSAFTGKHHFSTSVATMLRGLLDDDAEERWTVDEIAHWMLGHSMHIRHKATATKPTRPLKVGSTSYNDKRLIACALYNEYTEFVRLTQNEELMKWVNRASMDHHLNERLIKAVNLPMLQRKGLTQESKILTRILMAFHPAAPIRYQNLAVMPDGISTILFKALARGENTEVISDILLADFPVFWYSLQDNLSRTQSDYMNRLEFATRMLERYGPERCLYETALWAPFLGQGFENYFVFTPHQYLMALEDVAGTAKQPSLPIDRHAAAFLAARDARFGDSVLDRLNVSLNETDSILTMLQTLATLQHRFNVKKLPNLANWFNTLLQQAIGRYHNRDSREKVRFDLREAAKIGDLVLMQEAIENPASISRDKLGFMQAREVHALLGMEINGLRMDMEPHSRVHAEIGKEVSTVVAGILSIILAICFLSMRGVV